MAIASYKDIPVTGPFGINLDNVFRCPVCGDDHVHLSFVSLVQDGHVLTIGKHNAIHQAHHADVNPYVVVTEDGEKPAEIELVQEINELRESLGYEAKECDIEFAARGSSVVVNMWCEEGHTFDYKLTFHKGKTLVNFQRRDDVGLARYSRR